MLHCQPCHIAFHFTQRKSLNHSLDLNEQTIHGSTSKPNVPLHIDDSKAALFISFLKTFAIFFLLLTEPMSEIFSSSNNSMLANMSNVVLFSDVTHSLTKYDVKLNLLLINNCDGMYMFNIDSNYIFVVLAIKLLKKITLSLKIERMMRLTLYELEKKGIKLSFLSLKRFYTQVML